MEKTRHLLRLVGMALLLSMSPVATLAGDYVNESRTISGAPQSTTERFSFSLGKDELYPHFELRIAMSQGRADLRILDPAGRSLQSLGAQSCALPLQPIQGATTAGNYTLELVTTEAVGTWHLRVCGGPTPSKASVWPGLASALGMMLVVIASAWLWRSRCDASWKWFWVGAALWTVAVAVKFAIAIPLNGPLLGFLKSSLPRWAYLAAGTIYGGAMTGVTEVLFTFIAGLIWRSMAGTASRAAGVGVGAGAFEAALLAIGAALVVIVSGEGKTGWSLVLLTPAVERVTAILCHVASRLLVLMAVASRRWVLFWCGFLLLSSVDGAAMLLYLTDQFGKISPWAIEGMLAAFGLVSIPIIRWCIQNWPIGPEQSTSPSVVGEGVEDAGRLPQDPSPGFDK